MRLLLIGALLCNSFSSLADIPMPPSDPVAACKNFKIGDICSTYYFSGTCQLKDTALTCIDPAARTTNTAGANTETAPPPDALEKNVETVHAKEVAATDGNVPKNNATDAKDDKAAAAQAETQGCTNFGPLSTSFLSLMSVIMGLFMAMRFRKR